MYNAKEYIDDIKLRCSRLSVNLELDDPTILTIINAARKKTQQATLALFPERYGKIVLLDVADLVLDTRSSGFNPTHNYQIDVYSIPLPTDFIDAHVVKLRFQLDGEFPVDSGVTHTNTTYNMEARRYDKRELYKVLMQSHNRPTIYSPIYSIERNPVSVSNGTATNTGTGYNLLIAGLDTASGYLFSEPEYVADTGRIEVWYTALVSELEEFPTLGAPADQEVTIPAEFEEMVMLNAMVACMQKVRAAEQITGEVLMELQEYEQEVMSAYTVTKQKAGTLLPSREAVPS